MRKRYVFLGMMCLLLSGCGDDSKKLTEITSSPEVTHESVIDETKKYLENETSELKVFMGSDYAVASRNGKKLTFVNETDEGYLIYNESAIEFMLSDESRCKAVITLENKTMDEIKSEYEVKNGEYEEFEESGYTVIESESAIKYALKQVDNIIIKMEIYNYSDGCITTVDGMLSIE